MRARDVGPRHELQQIDLRDPMRDTKPNSKGRTTVTGPTRVPQDRRQRGRLRELCDEVLASFRVARSRELISEREKAESREMLASLTPSLPR
jgi:hypothetical protein